ncbi:hypothetical protein B0H13DRAFT_1917618 [Mycena leptocephala]|nr:hypothetical protein B0H13DRAFT_1917618 [Mycena leptocephala]
MSSSIEKHIGPFPLSDAFSLVPGPCNNSIQFIGTLLNWAFFGILFVQVCIYFLAFPKDPAFSKMLVAAVFAIELLGTLANTGIPSVFSASHGDLGVLDEIGWAWFSTPIIGSISAAIGQCYFGWRIHKISHKLYIPALIIAVQQSLITMVQLVAGTWTAVEISLAKRFSDLQTTNVKPTAIWLVATSSCDSIIVASTVYYLLKLRAPEFKTTNARILRIVMITLETGLLCALFAIIDLFLFATYKGTNYHLSVCIELSKIYSNSMLATVIFRSGTRIGVAMEIDHCTLGSSRSESYENEDEGKEVYDLITKFFLMVHMRDLNQAESGLYPGA